jgi:hypothetical protein
MPRWPQKSEEKVVEVQVPMKEQWQIEHPEWVWDRKCQKCGNRTMLENPEVYDLEVFECQNGQCRAQYTLKTFYDAKGRFLREEFLGCTMGPVA